MATNQKRAKAPLWLFILGGFLSILVGIIAIFSDISNIEPPTSTPTATWTTTPTHTATLKPNTPIPTPSITPSSTSTSTPTSTMESTPTVTPSPTPDFSGILVDLANPQDGTEIDPIVLLAGSYRNLRPGWSIHSLIQPISTGGTWFPTEKYFLVPEGQSSGNWAFEAQFGEGTELLSPEQYNIRMVVATSDLARESLTNNDGTGFERIPDELITFNQITTVFREAYEAISEDRIVYSIAIGTLGDYEIGTINLDGSDFHRLTFTPGINELDPALSPDGKHIIYIRLAPIEQNTNSFESSIWLMDSNGQNQTMVIGKPNTTYEHPEWSPDGRYIAFSASEGNKFRQIYLYEFETGDTIQLTNDPFNSRFPSWASTGNSLYYSSFSPIPDEEDVYSEGIFQLDISDLSDPAKMLLIDNTDSADTHPSISPDGSMIAYTAAFNQDNREIHVFDLNSQEDVVVTTGANDQFPTWHPNGTTIYFESFRDNFISGIWVVNLDGTNITRTTPEDDPRSIRPNTGFYQGFIPIKR